MPRTIVDTGRSSDVGKTRRDIADCEARLAEARDALDNANEALDVALAGVGWHRVRGAFDGRLYQHLSSPGNLVPLGNVIAMVELEGQS